MLIARLTVTSLIAIAASCGSAAAPAANEQGAQERLPGPPAPPSAEPAPPVAIPLARLPAEIQAWAREQRQMCTEAEGRITAETFAPVTADFNGDGRTDYVLSAAESFECSAGMLLYLAGQVATYDFFISTPRGYTNLEGVTSAEPVSIATFEGRPVAMVDAGGPGAFERPFSTFAYGWNGREMAEMAFFDADGRRVNGDGTRFGGGGWARASFPEGLPPGFYAESCWPADPEGMGYLYVTAREWRAVNGYQGPIQQIERNGPVRYRFRVSTSDEGGNVSSDVINIQTGRGGEFSILFEGVLDGEEPRDFSRCEDRHVPAQVRRELGLR